MALNGLPKVNIDYDNGALGQTISNKDGLLCIAVCGATTADYTKFALAKPYSLRHLADLDALGISVDTNALLYQTVKDFYTEAQDGTQVYIVGYPDTLKMSDVLNKDNPYMSDVINATNGDIRGIVATSVAGTTPTITNGLDSDVPVALLNAQALGEWARTTKHAPIFTIIDGLSFNGNATDLADLKKNSDYRVAVVIGSITAGAANQAVGLVAGRIASNNVDKNIGRVADGALNVLTMFAGNNTIEQADTETIYNLSYITFRTFTGVAGYFIADDQTATKETDDYNHLTAVRTIDKAARIAYTVMTQQLLDKVQVRSDGTLAPAVTVSWQQAIENAIASNMTANNELSDNNGDNGVQTFIDSTVNVLATSVVNMTLRVRPFGYARFINILLGFTVSGN